MRHISLAMLALAVAACGQAPAGMVDAGQEDAGVDAGPFGAPSATYPAIQVDAPQVVNEQGGAVLTSPRIVPVFFANDDMATVQKISDFESKVGATNYWATATSEYGVGAATSSANVMSADMPSGTIDAMDVETWLATKLNANDPAFPAPDGNTVYALHYPAGVTITQNGATSCNDFGGYHSNISLDVSHQGASVAYAVIPRCSDFGGLKGLDAVTGAESHELIEAVTDPFPVSNPAFSTVDMNHFYWARAVGGGEVGDMCAQDPAAFFQFDELPYMVQRTWSNASVTAGHDPCVPELPGEVYFNSAPEMEDTITVPSHMGNVSLPGVSIPAGTMKTIRLDLYSAGATDAWSVQLIDLNEFIGGQATLQFDLGGSTGQNGQKLPLTIKATGATSIDATPFMIISTGPSSAHFWMGIVGNE